MNQLAGLSAATAGSEFAAPSEKKESRVWASAEQQAYAADGEIGFFGRHTRI
jgi:hypothetical protein